MQLEFQEGLRTNGDGEVAGNEGEPFEQNVNCRVRKLAFDKIDGKQENGQGDDHKRNVKNRLAAFAARCLIYGRHVVEFAIQVLGSRRGGPDSMPIAPKRPRGRGSATGRSASVFISTGSSKPSLWR